MDARYRVAIGVVLALTLAGCAAPLSGGTTDWNVSYDVANNADVPHEVRVAVAPAGVDGLDVTYANGSTKFVPVTDDGAPLAGAFDNATAISVRGPNVEQYSHRLAPGTGIGATKQVAAENITVIAAYWPADGEAGIDYGVATCGVGATDARLTVTIYPDGNSDVATACTG